MLIDLRVEGKNALVVGGGTLGERKAKSLIHHKANVTVISESFTPGLETLEKQGKITLIEQRLGDAIQLKASVKDSALVFAATNDPELNTQMSRLARDAGVLVCAVDMPEICDFYSPAVFQKGSIRVGICTDGKSPIMSKVLKERLAESVTEADSLNVELQSYARGLAKKQINEGAQRRNALYRIHEDPDIQKNIRSGNLDEAKTAAASVIEQTRNNSMR